MEVLQRAREGLRHWSEPGKDSSLVRKSNGTKLTIIVLLFNSSRQRYILENNHKFLLKDQIAESNITF